MSEPPRTLRQGAFDLGVLGFAAIAGGGFLNMFGVPAGWLSGAMIGVGALAAANRAAPLPNPLRQSAIVMAGVGMGSGLTPETIHTLARYPFTFVLMAAALVAMTAASYLTLIRSSGFSARTAFYSAVPGALSYVFIVAAPSGADMARVAVIQVFRLFILMALVPIAARAGLGAPNVSFAQDPAWLTILLVLTAAGLGRAIEARGVTNASLYAGIAVSALAHVSGWAPGRMGPAFQIAAQLLIGAWIGTRFIGFDWRLLRQTLRAATTSFLAAFGVALIFAWIASRLANIPFAEALAAFAPGGLEAMTMLAFALGLDPLFVGAHHLARFFMISLALPFAAKRIDNPTT